MTNNNKCKNPHNDLRNDTDEGDDDRDDKDRDY